MPDEPAPTDVHPDEDSGEAFETAALEGGLRRAFSPRQKPGDTSIEEIVTRTLGSGGRYTLQEELGSGGMGIVYRATDKELGRDVALKILKGRRGLDPAPLGRFREEARIAAGLQHPGIVPVYDMGFAADVPFITMKLVEGRTLREELASQPDGDSRRWLGILEQVCQAVAAAHEAGIIHRDLKPANVMLGRFDEVQVMDWGVAKILLQASNDSQEIHSEPPLAPAYASATGAVMGTPTYMSPEQARGDLRALDQRSDVFSLGAMLCEILTGQGPYEGTTSDEVRAQAASAQLEPALERLNGSEGPAELIELAKQCLHADPENRPESAGELARRLADHREGVYQRTRDAEIQAAQAGAAAAQERRVRRLVVALASTVVVAVLAGGVTWFWMEKTGREKELSSLSIANDAWNDAVALAERARVAPSPKAEALWTGVRSAVLRARSVMEAADVSESLRPARESSLAALADEATDALADLVRERQLARFEARLDTIRERRGTHWDDNQLGTDYGRAFSGMGIDLASSEAADQVRATGIAPRIAAALDDWLHRRSAPRPIEVAAMQKLALGVDPDPVRRKIRNAYYAKDVAAVSAILERPDALALPSGTIQVVCAALANAGRIDQATDFLKKVQMRRPGDFYLTFDLGYWLLYRDPPKPRDALVYLSSALSILPTSISTREHRMRAYRNLRRFDEAERDLEALYDEREVNATYWNLLGLIRRDQRRFDDAVRCFGEAHALNKDSPKAALHLGECYELMGKPEEAIQWAEKSVTLAPLHSHSNYQYARLLEQAGRFREAERYYRVCLAVNDRFHRAWVNLANTLIQLRVGRYDEAVQALTRALELMPSDAEARHNFALLIRSRGAWADAIAHLERATKDAGPRGPYAAQIKQSLRLLRREQETDQRLLTLLEAAEAPQDMAAVFALAQHCTNINHVAREARLWALIEEKRPDLFEEQRSSLTRGIMIAAQAASGLGWDHPKPTPDDRSGFRRLLARLLDRQLRLLEETADDAHQSASVKQAAKKALGALKVHPYEKPEAAIGAPAHARFQAQLKRLRSLAGETP